MLGEMTTQRYDSEVKELLWTAHRKALKFFKVGHTAYNPATHTLNGLTNLHLSFLAGRNPISVVGDGIYSLASKDKYYQQALATGKLRESSIMEAEWNYKTFASTVKGLQATEENMPKVLKAMYGALDVGKKVLKTAPTGYSWGDEVFKLGFFKQAMKEGMTADEAMDEANKWFFDYRDVPPGIRQLRDTGLMPFVSFTYKIIPAMSKAVVEHPERLAALMLMYKTVSDYAYEKQFGDEASKQKQIERAIRPERQQGRLFGIGPDKQVRLANDPETGEARTLDVGRMLPGSDLFRDQFASFPFAMAPPLSLLFSLTTGQHPLFGNKVIPYDEPKNEFQEAENFQAKMKLLSNAILPNVPGLPYAWSTDRIGNALVAEEAISPESGWLWNYAQKRGWSGKDYFGNEVDLSDELLRSAGVPINRTDVPQATEHLVKKKLAAIGHAGAELSKELNKLNNTEARREAAVKGYEEQVGKATQELEALAKLLGSD